MRCATSDLFIQSDGYYPRKSVTVKQADVTSNCSFRNTLVSGRPAGGSLPTDRFMRACESNPLFRYQFLMSAFYDRDV